MLDVASSLAITPQFSSPLSAVFTAGSTPLRDPRHERFAHFYAAGLSAQFAYVRAGFSEKASKNGPKLLQNAGMQERIDFLVAHRRDAEIDEIERTNIKLRLTAHRVLEELSHIAFSNQMHYVKFDKRGRPYFDLTDLTEEQYAAIQELTIETDALGNSKVKVKLYDKKAALLDLGRHLGLSFTGSKANGADDAAEREAAQKPVAYVNIIIAGDKEPRATLAVNAQGNVIQNDEALRVIPAAQDAEVEAPSEVAQSKPKRAKTPDADVAAPSEVARVRVKARPADTQAKKQDEGNAALSEKRQAPRARVSVKGGKGAGPGIRTRS